jgi:hypothetical protein
VGPAPLPDRVFPGLNASRTTRRKRLRSSLTRPTLALTYCSSVEIPVAKFGLTKKNRRSNLKTPRKDKASIHVSPPKAAVFTSILLSPLHHLGDMLLIIAVFGSCLYRSLVCRYNSSTPLPPSILSRTNKVESGPPMRISFPESPWIISLLSPP